MTDSPRRRGASTRTIVLVSVGLLAVLFAGMVWLGIRTLQVRDELQALAPIARELESVAASRDLDPLKDLAAGAAAHAQRAAELTDDPIWAIGEAVPLLGSNFTAVRVVSQQLDAVASSGVQPLLDLLEATQAASSPEDGLDLAVIQDAQQPLAKAATVFATADAELAGLERESLLPVVAAPIDDVSEALGAAAPMIEAIARASEVLPGMLGVDGPRSILVMLQNNAELRTGGGITGSFVLLSAVDGHVTLVEALDSSAFRRTKEAVVPVPESTEALYGDIVGRYVQNTTMTSDFVLSAHLAGTWWERATGETPDTIVSIDPLVLSALLDEVGPATLPDASALTADNLIDRLLVEPYLTLDPVEQTVFQREVTDTVLTHLLHEGIDPLGWAAALRDPIDEGRVSMWSAHPEEQALLADGALAGPSVRHAEAGPTAFAVYLNDTTGGKMDSYLDVRVGASAVACRADGHEDVVVAVTLKSSAPADAATRFPISMTGGGRWGTPAGRIDTDITVAAPPGSFFAGATKDGQIVPSVDVVDNGFPSSLVQLELAPGEERTAYFRFIASEPEEISPTVLTTPLLHPATIDEDFVATCAN